MKSNKKTKHLDLDDVEQLRIYLQTQPIEVHQSFIRSINLSIRYWRKHLLELEHKNAVIRHEIARRRNAPPPEVPTCDIDVSTLTSVLSVVTLRGGMDEYRLPDDSGGYTVSVLEDHPCYDAIRVMTDEWEIINTGQPHTYPLKQRGQGGVR